MINLSIQPHNLAAPQISHSDFPNTEARCDGFTVAQIGILGAADITLFLPLGCRLTVSQKEEDESRPLSPAEILAQQEDQAMQVILATR